MSAGARGADDRRLRPVHPAPGPNVKKNGSRNHRRRRWSLSACGRSRWPALQVGPEKRLSFGPPVPRLPNGQGNNSAAPPDHTQPRASSRNQNAATALSGGPISIRVRCRGGRRRPLRPHKSAKALLSRRPNRPPARGRDPWRVADSAPPLRGRINAWSLDRARAQRSGRFPGSPDAVRAAGGRCTSAHSSARNRLQCAPVRGSRSSRRPPIGCVLADLRHEPWCRRLKPHARRP